MFKIVFVFKVHFSTHNISENERKVGNAVPQYDSSTAFPVFLIPCQARKNIPNGKIFKS